VYPEELPPFQDAHNIGRGQAPVVGSGKVGPIVGEDGVDLVGTRPISRRRKSTALADDITGQEKYFM